MNIRSKQEKDAQISAWIGLVTVRPAKGSLILGNAKGAIVNAIAMAATSADYERAIRGELDRLGLEIVEIEDLETVENRLRNWDIDPELMELIKKVEETGMAHFGTFHSYLDDETV